MLINLKTWTKQILRKRCNIKSQLQIKNLNSPLSTKEIKAVVKNLSKP